MKDQQMAQQAPGRSWEQRHEVGFDLLGIGLPSEAESLGDPAHVRVDDDADVDLDDAGGLGLQPEAVDGRGDELGRGGLLRVGLRAGGEPLLEYMQRKEQEREQKRTQQQARESFREKQLKMQRDLEEQQREKLEAKMKARLEYMEKMKKGMSN